MRRTVAMMLFAAPALVACGASAQQPVTPAPMPHGQVPTISVTGTGLAEREPDRAVLIVAVETQARTAQEAARANATRASAVVQALRRAGVRADRIRTLDYNLFPDYRHEPNESEPRLIGYRAANRVEAVIDSIAIVGATIDAAIEAGANRVDQLQFGLRNAEAARHEALANAVANARANAEVLARAASVRLGAPLHINSAFDVIQNRPVMMERLMSADAAQATPVEPGALSIRATVFITYRLE